MSLPRKNARVNLACGPVYVDASEWINLDFSPSSPAVIRANLLKRLPLADQSVSVAYSSHFLEHVPRSSVSLFLAECFRILEPGGVVRLVLPDLENLAREYLKHRDAGSDEKAKFLVLELIDQSVRSIPGGQLGRFYDSLRTSSSKFSSDMAKFAKQRLGENIYAEERIRTSNRSRRMRPSNVFRHLIKHIIKMWILLCVRLLPPAFREQNVSLAEVGERHQWLWDLQQLKSELEQAGFVNVKRHSASDSSIKNFPFKPLDIDVEGLPRKGESSMYVEAVKPGGVGFSR